MNNWKELATKEAAAQEGQVNDDDVEIAFSEQAWMQIQNKLRPLADPQYQLGFEIVWKNDSNSKMLGIYAFRVGKRLYYAPVFFVNGKIKGTELFYREDSRTFIPANPEWADYLISLGDKLDGDPIDRKEYDRNPKQMDLTDISYAPNSGPGGGSRKRASAAFTSMCENIKEATAAESPIKKFLMANGTEAFMKLSSAMLNDDVFASNMVALVAQEDWMIEDLPATAVTKQASVSKPAGIYIYRDQFDPRVPAEKRAAHMKSGTTFEDTRADSGVDEVYEYSREIYETIVTAGTYNVLMSGGEIRALMVIPISDLMELHGDNSNPTSPDISGSAMGDTVGHAYWTSNDQQESGYKPLEKTINRYMLIDAKTRETKTIRGKVYGVRKDEVVGIDSYLEEPKAGTTYLLVDRGNSGVNDSEICQCTFHVSKRTSRNGVTTLTGGSYHKNGEDGDIRVKIHSDIDGHNYNTNVFAKDRIGFLRVASEVDSENGYTDIDRKELSDQVGDENDLSQVVGISVGYKKATLSVSNGTGEPMYNLQMEGQDATFEMDQTSTIGYVMKTASVREQGARDLVAKADELGVYDFFAKQAFAGVVLESNDPHFYEGSINEFGVRQEDATQNTELNEVRDDMSQFYYNSTLPDTHNEMQNEDRSRMETATPNELAQHAQEKGQRSVFEHGVVGSLAKTYDASDVLKTYIPDLVQAVDKLGRTTFLFHWKPEDFVEAYGSDDQADLEQMLQSNFKSLGELLLELLQKNPEEDVIDS